MLIKQLECCKEFIAGDLTVLREILHPSKENLKIHYSLAHAKVSPGKSSVDHKLKTSEVYYILEGKGIMYIDGKAAEVAAGATIYIPPGAVQRIHNTENSELMFLCIVDPPWREEEEEII
ncbi:MAG: cupin domain-containing protein [SAR324 cluster bacterium]|nr:cupin domain-containing protein [SAR324 cluster bacterium]